MSRILELNTSGEIELFKRDDWVGTMNSHIAASKSNFQSFKKEINDRVNSFTSFYVERVPHNRCYVNCEGHGCSSCNTSGRDRGRYNCSNAIECPGQSTCFKVDTHSFRGDQYICGNMRIR